MYLEGATTRQYTLSREHQGPRAVLNALDRLAGGYGSECVRTRQDLAIAESQLRDYEARLGNPFLHEAYLSELTILRDQFKAGLSGSAHESGNEAGPTVPQLADRIKAIKSANTIEATPQRVRQKHSTAEEPITARIRRRSEAIPASDPAIESNAVSGDGAAVPPESAPNSSIKPQMTFQERLPWGGNARTVIQVCLEPNLRKVAGASWQRWRPEKYPFPSPLLPAATIGCL